MLLYIKNKLIFNPIFDVNWKTNNSGARCNPWPLDGDKRPPDRNVTECNVM